MSPPPGRTATASALSGRSAVLRQGVLIALVVLIVFGALRYDNFLGLQRAVASCATTPCSRWSRSACASSS